MEQRGVEHHGRVQLKQQSGALGDGSDADQECDPASRRNGSPQRHHGQKQRRQRAERQPAGCEAQIALLQNRLGGDRLQHRSGNHRAIRRAEAVAKFKRCAADNDLLVLQARQRFGLAAQHIDEGDDRQRGARNAEVDQEVLGAAVETARQHGRH